MRVVKASAVYMDASEINPYQMIERVGRTCYKSEDKITADSAIGFCMRMKNSGHWAMLEHGYVFFKLAPEFGRELIAEIDLNDRFAYLDATKIRVGNYLNITEVPDECAYVSGSFRAMLQLVGIAEHSDTSEWSAIKKISAVLHRVYSDMFENSYDGIEVGDLDIIQLLTREGFIASVKSLEDDYDEAFVNRVLSRHLPHTVIFTCDRGVSHEFVRHRVAAFGQESTRYCNYTKEKFGGVSVIDPLFWDEAAFDTDDEKATAKELHEIWRAACKMLEVTYNTMIGLGASPQQARSILPNSTKTEIAITAVEEEWQHMINLRYHGTTGKPHPQMVEAMNCIYDTLCEKSEHRLA